MKTLEDVKQAGVVFCLQHGFNPATANLAHDGCHTVSGYPATTEGEKLQAGWELAIMDVSPKESLSELEIEGFLVGCEFKDSNPELADLLSLALQTI